MIEITPEKEKEYLKVAELLYKKTPLPYIEKQVKNIGGKTIGNVKKLMDKGYITVDPVTLEASFAKPVSEAMEFLEELEWKRKRRRLMQTKDESPAQSAEEAVEKVMKIETAREASERTNQYMQIGRQAAQAYWKWAQKMGIPLEQAVKHDIGKIVSEALDTHTEAKKLKKRVNELEEALRMLSREVDPIIRLKNACQLVYRFLEFATLAEIVGFNIEDSPLVQHYQSMIESYLQGEAA